MAAADDGLAAPPGYTFCPEDKELTDIYLHRKIAGHAFPVDAAGFFHDADVYSAEPEMLAQAFLPAPGTGKGDKPAVWYFFCAVRYAGKNKNSGRRSRTIGGDGGKTWHSEKMAQPVKGGSGVGGYVQRFSYLVKNKVKASSGKEKDRAGWIMMEYGISPEHGGGRLVLCKVYPSTYPHKTAADSPGINFRKRKAAAGDHPEAPTTCARQRNESETCYGDLDLDSVANEDVNMYPITRRVTLEQEAAEGTTAAHLPMFFDQGTTEHCFGIADPVPETEIRVAADSGLVDHQPFSFSQEMEQEFEASYPIPHDVMVDGSGGDLATPPCAPAADQPEEDAAGLVQNISGEDQNNGGDGAAGTQLYEQAAEEVIYGLSCQDPGFSPEMLERLLSE